LAKAVCLVLALSLASAACSRESDEARRAEEMLQRFYGVEAQCRDVDRQPNAIREEACEVAEPSPRLLRELGRREPGRHGEAVVCVAVGSDFAVVDFYGYPDATDNGKTAERPCGPPNLSEDP
jgi:hypothetical protein